MTWPAPSGKITMALVAVQTPPGRLVSATYFGIDVLHPSCTSGNKVLDVSCKAAVYAYPFSPAFSVSPPAVASILLSGPGKFHLEPGTAKISSLWVYVGISQRNALLEVLLEPMGVRVLSVYDLPNAYSLFGKSPLLSRANCLKAMAICFPLERSLVCFARRCTPMNAGRAMLARMAMIAITMSNSIKVNAEEDFVFIYVFVTECGTAYRRIHRRSQRLFLTILWGNPETADYTDDAGDQFVET